MLLGAAIVLSCSAVLVWLLSPHMRHSTTWRATATPLASIIGSGFLIVAPLLGATVGRWAAFALSPLDLPDVAFAEQVTTQLSCCSYGLMIALAIALTWTIDLFEVIALASRAFALYYATQPASAVVVARGRRDPRAWAFACSRS